jgi:hypothetical protein
MTAVNALEQAYGVVNPNEQFTYALQWYGNQLGYLVIMINETYDSFISKGGAMAQPFFYWEFYLNGQPAQQGVSYTVLNAGDEVKFTFEMYSSGTHAGTLVTAKHRYQTEGII